MIKKIITFCLLITFCSSICFANEPSISSIKKGQVAEFSGILYNYEANSIILTELDMVGKTCDLQGDHIKKIEQENCSNQLKEVKVLNDASQNIIKLELGACQNNLKITEELVKKPVAPIVIHDEPSKWYVVLWIAIGVGLGASSIELARRLNN